jgi:hypothetical protein
MSSKVKNIYKTLTDELERTFLSISRTSEVGEVGKTSFGFVDYEGLYSDRRDPGKVIFDTDDSGRLEYLYRLRFRADENESEKVYWYESNFGWSDEQVLVAEKDNIMAVVTNVEKRCDTIGNRHKERLTQLFEELTQEIENKRRSLTIDDVTASVRNRDIDKLQNIISPNERAAVEFWKLLYSYGEDEIIDNPLSVEFSNDYVAMFRSERIYKSSDTERSYPFFLAVCVDDIPSRFIVKRIRRSKSTSNVNEWDEENVNRVLGYDKDYRDVDKIEPKNKVKIHGDIRAISYDYNNMREKYERHLMEEIQNRISNLYARMYVDRMNLELKNNVRFGKGIRIDKTAITEETKDIQDGLDISEDEVRKLQDDKNIGRLSSNLRREIVESVFDTKVTEWIYNRTKPEIEKFQKEQGAYGRKRVSRISEHRSGSSDRLRDLLIDHTEDLTASTIKDTIDNCVRYVFEDESEVSVSIRDAKITFLNGAEHPRVNYISKDFSVRKSIIIPKSTTAHIDYEGTHKSTINFNRGVYEFKELKGMRVPSF